MPHKYLVLYPRYQSIYNLQKTLHMCNGYKQVEGYFLVSPLDSRCSSDNTSGTFYTSLSTIYWQMMVIHINDPPTQAGALHIIFLKLGQGIINFYQFVL